MIYPHSIIRNDNKRMVCPKFIYCILGITLMFNSRSTH